MLTTKRVLLVLLVAVLLLGFVPWGKAALAPCSYVWRYAIGLWSPATGVIPPHDDGSPRFPPLCLDIYRLQGVGL